MKKDPSCKYHLAIFFLLPFWENYFHLGWDWLFKSSEKIIVEL